MGCYVQIDGQTDVVFSISWQLNGADGSFNSSIGWVTEVPYVAGQPFTPYADLTQDQVLAWIDQYTSAQQMAVLKQIVADNIAIQKEITYPPLPWEPAV